MTYPIIHEPIDVIDFSLFDAVEVWPFVVIDGLEMPPNPDEYPDQWSVFLHYDATRPDGGRGITEVADFATEAEADAHARALQACLDAQETLS